MFYSYADKNTPFTLSPASLDWHLARGWYRMGSTIFTTHFLFFNNKPYSALWLRVDLKNFTFSKSQRKLLRKNAALFSIASGPRLINAEREGLYLRYAANFDGRLSPTIGDSLEDYGGETVFNTFEVTVRERVSSQLVACSYFDLGGDSAASILGIYDPMLNNFSLGYYTMLLEMKYCLDQGFRYYYPGYVVPGYQRFDYKLRLGKSQYYDIKSEGWHDYSTINPDLDAPVESQRLALDALLVELKELGRVHRLCIYPLFEAGLYDIWNDDYFPYPYLVPITEVLNDRIVVVAFDPKELKYFVIECHHMVETQLLFNTEYLLNFNQKNYFTDLLSVSKVHFETTSVHRAAEVCVGVRLRR